MAGFEPTGTATSHSVFDTLGYAWGQCTAFLAENVPWLNGAQGLGNAKNWLSNAAAQGYGISSTPVAGSIAVFGGNTPGSGGAGHVAEVTGVSGSTFSTAEANVQGLNVVSAGDYSTSNTNLLGFILPKGGASPSVPASLMSYFPSGAPQNNLNPNAGTNPSPGLDLNPFDLVGGIVGGIEGFLLRLLIGVLAVILVIKGLELIGNSTGHDLSITMPSAKVPSGRSTGGATEGIAEDAGEVAA